MLSHDPHSHPDLPPSSPLDYALVEKVEALCAGRAADVVCRALSRVLSPVSRQGTTDVGR